MVCSKVDTRPTFVIEPFHPTCKNKTHGWNNPNEKPQHILLTIEIEVHD
jgi:hypothetical protein